MACAEHSHPRLLMGSGCAGEWTTVYLPWRDFVPVVRAKVDGSALPLNPSKIEQLGLVLSRFEFNELPNANYRAGAFELQARRALWLANWACTWWPALMTQPRHGRLCTRPPAAGQQTSSQLVVPVTARGGRNAGPARCACSFLMVSGPSAGPFILIRRLLCSLRAVQRGGRVSCTGPACAYQEPVAVQHPLGWWLAGTQDRPDAHDTGL